MRKLGSLILVVIFVLAAVFGGVLWYDNAYNSGLITESIFGKPEEQPEEHIHNFGATLDYDATHHFNKCIECGQIKNGAKHDFKWVIDTAESDYANGAMHEECVCGITRGSDVINNFVGTNDVVETKNTFKLNVDNDATFIYNNAESFYLNTVNPKTTTVSFGSGVSKNANFKIRYTAVLQDNDGFFRLNNGGMILQDKNGNYATMPDGSDWVSLSYAMPGFVINNIGGEEYRIMLDVKPNKSNLSFSLDVVYNSYRYKIFNDDITALCLDFLQCGYLDFEFGIIDTENTTLNNNYLYGLRFATENCEVTYMSYDSGTIRNSDIVKGYDAYDMLVYTTTVNEILSWPALNGVYNDASVNAILSHSYYSGKYSKEQTGAIYSFYSTSEWFKANASYILSNNRIEA